MSAFKDLVEADRDIFINIDEFGEMHDIDGSTLKVVLEDIQIDGVDDEKAVSGASLILYAKTEELSARKMRGETVYIDDVGYEVETWLEEMGITRVTLSHNEVY